MFNFEPMLWLKNIFSIILLAILLQTNSFAQNSQTTFGKNRIQTKNFKWEYLSTNHFDIYFYYGGRESAIYAAKYAETDYKDLCRSLGLSTYRNLKLLVYNTPKDLLMSNLAFDEPEPALGGVSNLVKSRAEVCFQGNHAKFRSEIRKEIARYLINEALYGGSIKDILKNTYLMNIPEWYISGLAYFSGYGYSEEMDNYVRSLAKTGKLKHPNVLTGKDAEMYGASVWNYVAIKHGQGNVANILQITQDTRNPSDAIAMVLGQSNSEFVKNWGEYYLDMSFVVEESYKSPDKSLKISKKNKKGINYTNVKISSTGEYVIYTSNYRGKYKVYVYDLRTKKRKVIYKGGYRVFDQTPDETMPLVSLYGDKIAVVDFRNGKFWLTSFNKNGKKDQRIELPEFENILSMNFSEDGNAVIFSGQMNGESDLWYLNFKDNTYKQVTLDFADDLDPAFVKGSSTKIIFSSNRQIDSLKFKKVYADKIKIKDYNENNDLFLFETNKGGNKLKRLTNTLDNEYLPFSFDANTLTYLADYDGIKQLYILNTNDLTSQRVTSFINSIKLYDLLPKTNYAAYVTLNKNRENVYFDPEFILKPSDSLGINTPRKDVIDEKARAKLAQIEELKFLKDSLNAIINVNDLSFDSEEETIDVDNYTFDDGYNTDSSVVAQQQAEKEKLPEDYIKIEEPRPYKNLLGLNSITNSLIFDNLKGMGEAERIVLADMLGNHKIFVTLNLFLDLRSSDMSVEYQYLKRRVDFSFKATKNRYWKSDEDLVFHRYGINSFQTKFSYPLTPATRISTAPHFTHQMFQQLFPSAVNFDQNNFFTGTTTELNIDNSDITGTNMRKGVRFKILYDNYLGVSQNTKSFSRFDMDFRGYLPIVNNLTFAIRGSAGKFFGDKYFMMGGADGKISFSDNKNYTGDENPLNKLTENTFTGYPDVLFNKFVTNVRGYNLNTVYGKNYFLINAELRLPFSKFFFAKQAVGSGFLRNLQIFGFGDLGAAWTGNNPFSRDNAFSKKNYNNALFSGYSITYSTPVLSSYGFGFRSFVFGYYLKADIVYPVRDFVKLDTKLILTIGHDF